ncbi:hypothetical protein GCM10010518_46320 [Kitasatospora cinereorecta]
MGVLRDHLSGWRAVRRKGTDGGDGRRRVDGGGWFVNPDGGRPTYPEGVIDYESGQPCVCTSP